MDSIDDMQEFLEETAVELAEASMIDKKSWYQTILEYGNELEHYPDHLRLPENEVKGCVSKVYVAAELKEGRVCYYATSDVPIVLGFLAVLVRAVNGLAPEDVEKAEQPLKDFLIKTNISMSLTPSRANAFGNTFKMMKEKAVEFLEED